MPPAELISTAAAVIGVLVLAFAVYWVASALVSGARKRDDRQVRDATRR